MNCLLLFHFIFLISSIILLMLGMTTPKWIVYGNEKTTNNISEYSNGILMICRKFDQQNHTDLYDEHFICFNRLSKWYKSSINGPELLDYQKLLIITSLACVFFAFISLLLSQLINTEISFDQLRSSRRILNCLLFTDILVVIFAFITIIVFFVYEDLQKILYYGYSFWSFVFGTCGLFLCCILIGVFRIDVEYEFHRRQHESIATLC